MEPTGGRTYQTKQVPHHGFCRNTLNPGQTKQSTGPLNQGMMEELLGPEPTYRKGRNHRWSGSHHQEKIP